VVVGVRVSCRACGHGEESLDALAVCPACGSAEIELAGGDELVLESIQLQGQPVAGKE
jgi:hydrogenase nickel incorporation protein HypA/HybF